MSGDGLVIGQATGGATITATDALTGKSATGSVNVTSGGPKLYVGDVTVSEGQDATFTVRLSPPSTKSVTVTYTTTDGTAKAGSDYTTANNTLTFPPGETSLTVTVKTLNDSYRESPEKFILTLNTPSGATLADASGTCIINDDEVLTGQLVGWWDCPGFSGDDLEELTPSFLNEGVLFGKTVTAISGGSAHCLALCSDGTLVAWGINYEGQLGNGTYNDSDVPVPVNQNGVLRGKKVVAVATGLLYSLAL